MLLVSWINMETIIWKELEKERAHLNINVHLCFVLFCYASAFSRGKQYVLGLSISPSVRPSVWSLKYPLSTCSWVCWPIRPTVTILQHVQPSVQPSVRPERLPGICQVPHRGNGLIFCMLMYLDHLQNWLVYSHGLLIFLILALFWLSEMHQIWGFPALPEERMNAILQNLNFWQFFAICIFDFVLFWLGI